MTIWGTGKGAGFGTKPNSERSNSAEKKVQWEGRVGTLNFEA